MTGRATRLLLATLLVAITASSAAEARPRPGAKPSGFRLFARSTGALTINRVYCGLRADGQVCADSAAAQNFGGLWPKGTADNYIFNSGVQLAGIVGGGTENPWAGDTTGAFFFNASVATGNSEPVRPIYNSTSAEDVASWPDAARVPDQPNEADELFVPLLRGRVAASQGDVWWLSWEGNPAQLDNRPHPLGVLVEQRGMGWNFPRGNEDIVYFIYTIYNITSTNPADYLSVRPAMREILLERAREFQARNDAAFGITLPAGGYPITDMFLAFAVDMDVAQYNDDFASVNLPFALGYTYAQSFSQPPWWSFDPGIFAPPFFAGSGIAGVKYLLSPASTPNGGPGLTNFSGYVVGGAFDDPGTVHQLYRYLSANLDPAAGDGQCNTGNPLVTHICFVNTGLPGDMRFFQSTGPLTLPPGGFGSMVVAYIFAAPVQIGSCRTACSIRPGDPTILGDPVRMAAGVNAIDSLTGYLGFSDANGDGRVQQDEFQVVPSSLLGKARVAQAVFDSHFLLPFAPEAPEFFLVPGDGQVTVIWRPSPSETAGDPYSELAGSATILPPGGGSPVPNPLYDPNYRQFDVEGYRIYRGRVDSPNSLKLLAQFDHTGTVISDYGGQINPAADCAPELGIVTGCPVQFDPALPGVPRSTRVDHPLAGEIVQVKVGDRARTARGTAFVLAADTAITGGGSGLPPLRDTGVPLVYVDRTVRNDLRYFYSVTAFDINSYASGPSSLEAPRVAKPVTPVAPASNYVASQQLRITALGRGTVLDTAGSTPALDPETGRFSGPFPPANAFRLGLVQAVQALLEGSGSFTATLDSLRLGSAYENWPSRTGTPARYFLTVRSATTSRLELAIPQDRGANPAEDSTFFPAMPIGDPSVMRYGGQGGFELQGQVALALPGNFYTNAWGSGCFAGVAGFTAAGTTGCSYNGGRWFDGPSPRVNEIRAHPQASHPAASETPGPLAELGNAGELTGVATIQMPHAYLTAEGAFAVIEGVLGGAQRAADFNLYWGQGGTIDSVIDVTHNVPVPFDSLALAGSWGVLNQAATTAPGAFDQRPDVLTFMDFTCVEPLRTFGAVQGSYPCLATEPFHLSRTAVPGQIAIWDQSTANSRSAAPRPGQGFALYLAGNLTIFELADALPANGKVWSLRTYVGAVSGGRGAAGNSGPYVFTPQPRPLSAVGVELRFDYTASNQVLSATRNDLSQVHTVPDPYYVLSKFEATTDRKVIKFVNLPERAIIRIYSSSGVLVALLEHNSSSYGGSETWDVLNRNDHVVASGVYFYHIEAGDARRVGRFTVVNYAH